MASHHIRHGHDLVGRDLQQLEGEDSLDGEVHLLLGAVLHGLGPPVLVVHAHDDPLELGPVEVLVERLAEHVPGGKEIRFVIQGLICSTMNYLLFAPALIKLCSIYE